MTTATRRARPPVVAADRADDWRDNAACRSEDPELFFPVGSGPIAHAQVNAAKRVCFGCPVRVACLNWARDNEITDGVWGGLSEAERRPGFRPKPPPSTALQIAAAKSADVRAERAAARTHCNNGHELTEDNVWMQGNHRVCRTCRRAQAAAWRVAHKAATA